LTGGADTLIVALPEQVLDPGAGFRSDVFATDLACSADHHNAYFLVNYAGEDDSYPAKSRIIGIGIETQQVDTLTETNEHVPGWRASRIELADPQRLISQHGLSADDAQPLTQIDLPGGTHSTLTTGLDVGGVAFTPALAQDRVYVATFAGIDEVDIAIPSKQSLSGPDPDGEPVVFPQARSLALDLPNQRLLVGDEELDAVIAVDIVTGERSTLISRNVGDGPGLLVPRRFVLSSDGATAYVLDDGGNQKTRLLTIDLADGSRSVVGDLGPSSLSIVSGIALDEEGNRVFAAGVDELIEIDLDSEGSRVVASSDGGSFGTLTALLLDAEAGRLLLADSAVGAILALDLVSEQIDVLSKPGERGEGPELDVMVSLARVGNALYVANQETEAILRVDLETGDRQAPTIDCPSGSSGVFSSLAQVLNNAYANELLISGDELYALDLDTQSCTQYPRRAPVFEIQVTPENQILAVYFNMLTHVDRESGEVVIVSK
jgi:DNA-binding beta-propeller fold protein YncE